MLFRSEAITFCLHGTSLSPIPAIPTPSAPVKVEKTEDALAKALISMTGKNDQLLMTLTSFLQTSMVSASSSNVPHMVPANSDFLRACRFCGGASHFIHNCPLANEMIRVGKCKHQEDGQITLPNSSLVPRNLPGAKMKEQIDEWHKQSSASTLIFQVPDDKPLLVMLLSKEEHLELLHQRIAAVEAQGTKNYTFMCAKRPIQNPVRPSYNLSLTSCLCLSSRSQNIHFIKPRTSLICTRQIKL